jgi:hypothetical protein
MTAHELIFGDRFERSLRYICGEAHKVGTPEAYRAAEQKLAGIKTLLIFMSSEGGTPMPTAVLMLQNLQSGLRVMEART